SRSKSWAVASPGSIPAARKVCCKHRSSWRRSKRARALRSPAPMRSPGDKVGSTTVSSRDSPPASRATPMANICSVYWRADKADARFILSRQMARRGSGLQRRSWFGGGREASDVARKLKIAHLVRQYHPSVGGLETYVAQLVQRQSARHRVYIITLNRVFGSKARLRSVERSGRAIIIRVPYLGVREFFIPLL